MWWQWNFANWSQVCCKRSPGLAGSWVGWQAKRCWLGSSPTTCLSSQALALEPCTGCQCRSAGVRTIIAIVAIIATLIWRIMLSKASTCGQCTVRPNKLAPSLGQRKVHCRAVQKNRWWESAGRLRFGSSSLTSPPPQSYGTMAGLIVLNLPHLSFLTYKQIKMLTRLGDVRRKQAQACGSP